MKFINPKIDLAFKKIFSSSENKDILIDFLNAILYEGNQVIADLEINDLIEADRVCGVKDTYLDVKAKTNDGRIAIVEIQVINLPSFGKRVLYNTAQTYAMQLTKEERYEKLKQVIALKIADFEMFDSQTEGISRFVFKEQQKQFDYPDTEIELVFVELPKFNKDLAKLENAAERWIYFIKNTSLLEEIPQKMSKFPAIYKAYQSAIADNFTYQELTEMHNQELWIQDQKSAIEMAREKATQTAQVSLILRQIMKRLGTIKPETENRIRVLSLAQLEKLGDEVLDFKTYSDLTAWFQANLT
jgi:predicted transposase/invertase (TIGR01784 family)